MRYDIIGDIHGQSEKLHALLASMGYRQRDGAYSHPNCTAIFVGDLIDRGPGQLDTLTTVRSMVDAGNALAVMGNHEFNAIAWHTPNADKPGEFLRPHSGEQGLKNRKQHAAFLAAVELDPALHQEVIEWFLTLPLWIDLPGLRVVHACWQRAEMEVLRPQLTSSFQLNGPLMISASRQFSEEYRCVEALTKGLEIPLPDGVKFIDKDGHARHEVRIRWWDSKAVTYRDLALVPRELRERLPEVSLVDDPRSPYDNAKPVFFGHYWMTGTPVLQSSTIACVDYSAGNGGPLVAYRWDGEPCLDARNFVSAM